MRALLRPEHALNLAVFRVTVPILILVSPEIRDAQRFASLASGLRAPPEGLSWLSPHLASSPSLAVVAQMVAVASALAAIAGVRARIALCVLTLVAFYLFATSQLVGLVTHDMHLLWFAALLAASPCDDALGWDARKRGGSWLALERAPSLAYAIPLLGARALLGLVYLFPGIWKLRESGFAWATSDNLRNQMWWKWYQNDWVPAVRVDQAPTLLHAAALGVIVFELSFIVLVLTRRGRVVAAIAGMLFHLMSDVLLRIPFFSLWGCYTLLFDWHRFATRSHPKVDQVNESAGSSRARLAAFVASFLVVAEVVQGIRGQTRSFPFACYPTFQWMVGTTMPDLEIEAVRADGSTTLVPHARDSRGKRSQRTWGMVWSLAGVGGPVRESRLRAYFETIEREAPDATRDAVVVRFYRVNMSVVPEERGAPATHRTLLREIRLAR